MKRPKINKATEFANIYGPAIQDDDALSVFTMVDQMPDAEPWNTIAAGYASTSQTAQMMATIMNGVASSQKRTFFMSRTYLSSYLSSDPNYDGTTKFNGERFDQILKSLTQIGFLVTLVESSKTGPNNKRAGLATVGNTSFSKHLTWWEDQDLESLIKRYQYRLESKLKYKPLTTTITVTSTDTLTYPVTDSTTEISDLVSQAEVDWKQTRKTPDGFFSHTLDELHEMPDDTRLMVFEEHFKRVDE